MTEYLASLGYLGAFLGAAVEGEILLLTLLQTAQLGYTNYLGILVAGWFGTFCMDWFLFLNGRYQGRSFVTGRERLTRQLDRMESYFSNHGWWLLLLYRFIYGCRIVLPLLFGIMGIPPKQFMVYSLISGLLWISLIGLAGLYVSEWFGITRM